MNVISFCTSVEVNTVLEEEVLLIPFTIPPLIPLTVVIASFVLLGPAIPVLNCHIEPMLEDVLFQIMEVPVAVAVAGVREADKLVRCQ